MSSPVITNATFSGNSALNGGAIFNDGPFRGTSSPIITNVTFTGNSADEFGGAIVNRGFAGGESSPQLTNVTFFGNSATFGGAIVNNSESDGESSPQLTNVILYGNTASESGDEIYNTGAGATPTLSHTLIEGGLAGISENSGSSTIDGGGTFDADPRFADTAITDDDGLDLRLKGPAPGRDASPAIDAGDNTALPADVTTDLVGEPRVTAVLGTEAIVDLGAYESTGAPLPVELASFTTSVEGQTVVLSWKTLSEKGSHGFAVESRKRETKFSAEGGQMEEWTRIGFVEAAGTTTEAQSYMYRVEDLDYGTYTFRLRQEDLDGTTETLGEVEADVSMAVPYVISKVYPNPSVGWATLEVAVREAQRVRVEVYDVLGRRVATPFDEEEAASDTHRVRLDGSRFSSGVYFVRVAGEDFSEMRRFVVAR